MQIASKQSLWNEGGSGTVVEVEMTETTGLYIRFLVSVCSAGVEGSLSWGDGSATEIFTGTNDQPREHTYPRYGKYKIRIKNLGRIGFRYLDGQSQYPYDDALVSIVDYGKTMHGAHSGGFKYARNLVKFIGPGVTGCGQRPFAYCTKLKEAEIGNCGIHYDGSFQGCTALEKFTTVNTGCCWSYVWKDCTKLTELKLGKVSQFATQDFTNTPLLKDIWISDKTVDQIKQVAASGNITAGYGAKFPWGACSDCRFHGTDGIVLGNGTRIA